MIPCVTSPSLWQELYIRCCKKHILVLTHTYRPGNVHNAWIPLFATCNFPMKVKKHTIKAQKACQGVFCLRWTFFIRDPSRHSQHWQKWQFENKNYYNQSNLSDDCSTCMRWHHLYWQTHPENIIGSWKWWICFKLKRHVHIFGHFVFAPVDWIFCNVSLFTYLH